MTENNHKPAQAKCPTCRCYMGAECKNPLCVRLKTEMQNVDMIVDDINDWQRELRDTRAQSQNRFVYALIGWALALIVWAWAVLK